MSHSTRRPAPWADPQAPSMPLAPARQPHRRYYLLALALILGGAIAPFWTVRFPGMIDYPSHLVRCYILAHFGSDPFWQHFYQVQFGPIPNLAIDAIVTTLARWLPIIVSGRIFLSLLAALYVVGCSVLARAATGRWHALALLAGLTVYNSPLLWGFVNYLFGLGLFFLVFALWLRVRQRMRAGWFAVFGGLSVVVYLAHLGAIATLGVACCTVALMDFHRARQIRALLQQTGWLAVPAFLLVFGFLGQNGRVGTIGWGSPWHKINALFTLVRSYNLRSDMAIAAGLAVCTLALLWRCRWQRELAAAGLVLMACCLLLPYKVFTSQNVDIRISLPAFVLLLLAVKPRWGRVQKAALAAAMALMALHMGLIAAHWQYSSQRGEQVLAKGSMLPRGARIDVLEGVGRTGLLANKWAFTLPKIVDYWSVSRGTYESNVFALKGQQPLIQRPPYANCWPKANERAACLQNFDYILTVDPSSRLRRYTARVATPVWKTQGAELWHLTAQAAAASSR